MSLKCVFCVEGANSPYSCPKCNAPYCSLKCYQSPKHYDCAEIFYKDWVKDELVLRNSEDKDSEKSKETKARMIETLQKLHDEDAASEDLDSDDDLDISERLANIDLEDADSLWKNLTKQEREEFEKMVDTGDISKILPKYEPWWIYHQEEKLVQEVENKDSETTEKHLKKCPPIDNNISHLKDIVLKAPSSIVKFGLLNVLYAYAYGVKYFYGEHKDEENTLDFTDLILTLSTNLSKLVNFESADQSLESAASNVNIFNQWALTPQITRDTKKDVYHIIRGPSKELKNSYILSCLSDLKDCLKLCSKKLKALEKSQNDKKKVKFNDPNLPPWERKQTSHGQFKWKLENIKKAIKKVEYYQSWAMDYGQEYDVLR